MKNMYMGLDQLGIQCLQGSELIIRLHTIGAVKLIVLGEKLAEDVTGRENVCTGDICDNPPKNLFFISYPFQAQ